MQWPTLTARATEVRAGEMSEGRKKVFSSFCTRKSIAFWMPVVSDTSLNFSSLCMRQEVLLHSWTIGIWTVFSLLPSGLFTSFTRWSPSLLLGLLILEHTNNNNHDIWEFLSFLFFPFQGLHLLGSREDSLFVPKWHQSLQLPLQEICPKVFTQWSQRIIAACVIWLISFLWIDANIMLVASTELLTCPLYIFKQFLFGCKVSISRHFSSICLPWGLSYCWSIGWQPLCYQIKIAWKYIKDIWAILLRYVTWCLCLFL